MERDSVIVGIHGLANKPPVDEKTRWWRTAIAEGLAGTGPTTDPVFSFAFVYWADLRYDTPLSDESNREPYRPRDEAGAPQEGEAASAITAKDALAPVYAGIDRIEEATGLTLVDDLILEHRFDDLWHYHGERRFAREVRDRLAERLRAYRNRRILLVAHSMGSVVAYDVLRTLEREDPVLRVAHLVTMGSPLGLAKVKLKFEAEHGALRVPNNVSAWTNLADGNDIVSIMGALDADYAESDAGISLVDKRVVNDFRRLDGEPNHHKSYGYLRTPEFASIARAYTAAPHDIGAGAEGIRAAGAEPATARQCRATPSRNSECR
ncbi:esterase/lipase family protein [Methylobacterium radiodurans]|uniref:esterase/lipase family protein n=1 Tax=Methylobacterium radiodurans TaxID=2202828 RepID=UPI001FE5F4FC|nr:host attachment protein [Methylobacterium radiodurans]